MTLMLAVPQLGYSQVRANVEHLMVDSEAPFPPGTPIPFMVCQLRNNGLSDSPTIQSVESLSPPPKCLHADIRSPTVVELYRSKRHLLLYSHEQSCPELREESENEEKPLESARNPGTYWTTNLGRFLLQ